VQGRVGARVGKAKKEEKGERERGEGKKKKREGRKKGSGKGILAIPILVCFRRRCQNRHRCSQRSVDQTAPNLV